LRHFLFSTIEISQEFKIPILTTNKGCTFELKRKNKKMIKIDKVALKTRGLRFIKRFRNKYLLTFTVFFVYTLFLDDDDLFKLIAQNRKLNRIEADHQLVQEKLKKTKYTLKQLDYDSEIERYAREQKMFKKDDEDIFIITDK
jgi:cell division protein DivIC